MTDVDQHLGRRLRRRRRLLGMTQADLAKKIGVRFQQIQKYECAANHMSAARLWQLATALDVTTQYFYEGLNAEVFETEGEVSLELLRQPEIMRLISGYSSLDEKQRRRLIDLLEVMNEKVDSAGCVPSLAA